MLDSGRGEARPYLTTGSGRLLPTPPVRSNFCTSSRYRKGRDRFFQLWRVRGAMPESRVAAQLRRFPRRHGGRFQDFRGRGPVPIVSEEAAEVRVAPRVPAQG